jgi:MFS family permease
LDRVLKRTEKAELMGLLFLHGMAMASWFVPLSSVLDAAGMGAIKSMAFAATAIAALLSPLFFGAMADRSALPATVLRWVSVATAIMVLWIAWGVELKWNRWFVLCLIQVQSLFLVPTSSLAGSIVLFRLMNSRDQYGSIRALGTLGWMAGCWTTSLLGFDASPKAFYLSGGLWLIVAAYTLVLQRYSYAPPSPKHLSLRERFGLDALSLLRIHDHRVVFITSTLVAIPFAAFYPYTPPQLSDLGFERLSAWMSLGQVSEVVAMIAIGGILARWRLKWTIMAGLVFGLMRYGLYAINMRVPVLIGLGLHGFAFTFTYISTQIYLAKRVEAEWQSRAQALLSLLSGGIGNLTGYLITGVWMQFCRTSNGVQWTEYWLGLATIVLLVLIYFSIGYRGKS